jgi:HEAT repeat protein
MRPWRHGQRLSLARRGSIPDEQSETVLIDLLADPDVAGHAIMALGKLGTQKAANVIKPFLKHKTPWLRVEAEKALSLIDTHAKSATDR